MGGSIAGIIIGGLFGFLLMVILIFTTNIPGELGPLGWFLVCFSIGLIFSQLGRLIGDRFDY